MILRLTKGARDPVSVAGAWSDMTEEEAEILIQTSRKDFEDVGGGQ
ncbi:MAG: hypothetical protein ACE5HJ_08340 [Thermoplasmata archaeon]